MFVGKMLYGNCKGYFTGEYFDRNRRIEAIGSDWIVARNGIGEVCFASFDEVDNMEELIKEWSKKPKEEEEEY